MGYRRIRDELDGHKGIHVNDKRVLRICRKYDIKSNIKWKPKSCTRGDRNPDHIAKNYLHREFHAEKPNEKWLTDVSEFKYYNGIEVHKVYLSAILDLYDRRIVSFKISDHNDNPLVMDTFDEAVRQEPDAHPLVHSDYAEEKTMPKNLITSCILIIRIQFFGIVFRVSQARRLLSLYQRSSTAFRHRQLWEQTC
jgi:transposase InsO family protein